MRFNGKRKAAVVCVIMALVFAFGFLGNIDQPDVRFTIDDRGGENTLPPGTYHVRFVSWYTTGFYVIDGQDGRRVMTISQWNDFATLNRR